MTRGVGRALAALVFALVAAGGLASPAVADSAVPGACTDSSGVTVVVDFQSHLGGAIRAGCASAPVSTGFDALTKAGFTLTQTIRSPGFVCRIDGQPADDPCLAVAPITAYWSYWYALPGQGWTYSSLGGGNRVPPPGSVEGWSFSYSPSGASATPPRIAPPNATAPPTTVGSGSGAGAGSGSVATTTPSGAPVPTPSPGRTQKPAGTTALPALVGGQPGPTGSTPSTLAPSTTEGSGPTASTTVRAGGSATSTPTSHPTVQVESATASRARSAHGATSSSGSAAAGSIVALFAIVVAGTAAGVISRRRARAG